MLELGICWMEAGPMGMAITDWLVGFITSAKDFPLGLEQLIFALGCIF